MAREDAAVGKFGMINFGFGAVEPKVSKPALLKMQPW